MLAYIYMFRDEYDTCHMIMKYCSIKSVSELTGKGQKNIASVEW